MAELLETQQPLVLLRRTLAAQHGLPEVLHQFKAVLQQAASSLPPPLALGCSPSAAWAVDWGIEAPLDG